MTEKQVRPTPKPPARVHPNDRGRVEGLNALATLIQGAPQPKTPLSYYTPILIHCTLPHSDPKTVVWQKTNGDVSLIVASGFDRNLQPYGIPYGSFPRLVLAYIITRVIQTGERSIVLSSHFSTFLKEIGYTGNLRGNTRAANSIRSQLLRLLMANFRVEASAGTEEKGVTVGEKIDVARKYALWWDYKNPDQDSLWGSYIEISEEFREAILRAPVPLRTDILKVHRKSPLALDVYMWVSYRLFTMRAAGQESISLGYGRLQEQFGTGISEKDYRTFRSRFKHAFTEVAGHWRPPDSPKSLLNHELNETGLVLYRSPFLIAQPKAIQAQEKIQGILERRRFDQETRRRAHQLAGQWDVDYLEKQYFGWIEQEGIMPKDASAHFLDFITTHRKRHGENL
jgi:replication initiator protein